MEFNHFKIQSLTPLRHCKYLDIFHKITQFSKKNADKVHSLVKHYVSKHNFNRRCARLAGFVPIHGAYIAFFIALQWKCQNLLGEK